MAERTSRSFSEQEQRIHDIAQQGASRIQRSRDEGVGKMAAVHTAAVQASDVIEAVTRPVAAAMIAMSAFHDVALDAKDHRSPC